MSGRTALADTVVARLLESIREGRYPVDARLPRESELAEDARVSRLTLREAVRVLRDKGVLRVEQGRGTFVNPPEHWSVLDPSLLHARLDRPGALAQAARQLTEARSLVEVGGAGLAAQRRSAEDLAALWGTVDRMRQAHEGGDVAGFSAADVAFHDTLAAAAGNPFLTGLLQPVRALLEEVRVATSTTAAMRDRAIEKHTEILRAVVAGDGEAARARMSEHMADTQQALDRIEGLEDPDRLAPAPVAG
ncbi:FadR/GntR family transcriptional regulator [Ornithinicoccus halotolerans]|uniref:FadR/GntR family transcriptional regulator n=1 Tax=Ornithinicoccus halotolerans TaxID=1748220 RepID=UPI001294D40C|nr:FadR/GntR family transcriptional regulator [Ornithinicoccus halotolerans]